MDARIYCALNRLVMGQRSPPSWRDNKRARPLRKGPGASWCEDQLAKKFSPTRIFLSSRPVRVSTSSMPTRARNIQ